MAAELPTPTNVVGADVSDLILVDADGDESRLRRDKRTVVLVFNSECIQCETKAPAWQDWLAKNPDTHTLAVSTEAHGIASAFASRHGWGTEVFTARTPWLDTRSRGFMARTPWIYLVSETGTIEASIYGGDLRTLSVAIPHTNTSRSRTDA